ANARDTRRDRVHQYGTRIARGSSGDVDTHRIERSPAPAQRGAGFVRERSIGGELTPVIGLDALRRELQSFSDSIGTLLLRGGDFAFADPQSAGGELHAVEEAGIFDQGRIATRTHIRDDGGHRL